MSYFSIHGQERSGNERLKERFLKHLRNAHFFRGVLAILCSTALGLFASHVVAADAAATLGSAKNQTPITIELKQFKVLKDEHGNVKLMDASAVLPGDVIEYRALYSNRGNSALPVIATLPIPESLEYLKDSATADNKLAHTVALKDSQFSKEPLVQKFVTASGSTVSQPLPYASYRYVRWDLGNLPSGKSIEVSVRAKVAQNLVADASAEDRAASLPSSLAIKK